MKLHEYGELNQSKLMSICGLNNVKHKGILDYMVNKGFLEKTSEEWGSKTIYKYKMTQKGMNVLKQILEPYEELFPREESIDK